MTFFGGPQYLLPMLDNALTGQPAAAWEKLVDVFRGDDAKAYGAQSVVIASTVGLPSLIPTVVNFIVLSTLTIGRILGLTALPVLKTVHRLLFVPEGADPKDAEEARNKSTIFIVGIIVVAVILGLKLLELIFN